ncbi:hypothetical protein K491DRAFT_716320 [Lophiostoma macrostomum CBS 122681]|uniref:Secreted protein n=1 Tax=Lophiostoma macrostomum CBS 122681 TaxID=1314788 RepID=A0A6A6T5S5_9PLEO|nr:hypothetical protein K491DRAFT_716320 [Lophiostoma macrostomum CBS 122681]
MQLIWPVTFLALAFVAFALPKRVHEDETTPDTTSPSQSASHRDPVQHQTNHPVTVVPGAQNKQGTTTVIVDKVADPYASDEIRPNPGLDVTGGRR